MHNDSKISLCAADAPAEIPFCDAMRKPKVFAIIHSRGGPMTDDYLQTGNLSQVMDQFLGKPFTEGFIGR